MMLHVFFYLQQPGHGNHSNEQISKPAFYIGHGLVIPVHIPKAYSLLHPKSKIIFIMFSCTFPPNLCWGSDLSSTQCWEKSTLQWLQYYLPCIYKISEQHSSILRNVYFGNIASEKEKAICLLQWLKSGTHVALPSLSPPWSLWHPSFKIVISNAYTSLLLFTEWRIFAMSNHRFQWR